jgi:hypothetical protein
LDWVTTVSLEQGKGEMNMKKPEKRQSTIMDFPYMKRLEKSAYNWGYAKAIEDADRELRAMGDDRTVRECRGKVLALIKNIKFDENEVVEVSDDNSTNCDR